MSVERTTGLFSALLRYWRSRRGLSQLDLALSADVSARHVSFLETGRAKPSEEMVLRLAATLEVPLREQNDMLEAAGFARRFDEPGLDEALAGPVGQAVERMLTHYEPFPMMVLNDRYDVLRLNRGAHGLLARFVAEPAHLGSTPNVVDALFDPRLVRPFVVDWASIAQAIVSRLHREALHRRPNERLAGVLARVLKYPGVPASFCQPDFSTRPAPAFAFRLERGDLSLSLLTMVTVLSSPMNVTLEELQIESYFPLDDQSEATLRRLAESPI